MVEKSPELAFKENNECHKATKTLVNSDSGDVA